jgi:hypothetical protein
MLIAINLSFTLKGHGLDCRRDEKEAEIGAWGVFLMEETEIEKDALSWMPSAFLAGWDQNRDKRSSDSKLASSRMRAKQKRASLARCGGVATIDLVSHGEHLAPDRSRMH